MTGIDGIAAIHARISFLRPTLILEAIALSSFGLSWLTKGEFILKDKPTVFGTLPQEVVDHRYA